MVISSMGWVQMCLGRSGSQRGQGLALWHKLQCHAVVAVTQACGARAVIENVTMVAAAAGAVVFGAR
jgi:hypothetical protein